MERSGKGTIERIEKEIPHKGKGYLVIRQCPPEILAETLDREVSALFFLGAERVYAASADTGAPLKEGMWGPWRLTFCHEMVDLFLDLDKDRPAPIGLLSLKPLCPGEEDTWLELYNQAFFYVPNSTTLEKKRLKRKGWKDIFWGLSF